MLRGMICRDNSKDEEFAMALDAKEFRALLAGELADASVDGTDEIPELPENCWLRSLRALFDV